MKLMGMDFWDLEGRGGGRINELKLMKVPILLNEVVDELT